MKFEKFYKNSGMNGQLIEMENGDKWLICNRVGMKVPDGVVNLLGTGATSEKTRRIVEAITEADIDDKVVLSRAWLKADGKPTEIVRIFTNDFGDGVGIVNKDFGLIERSDYNLCHIEVVPEDEEGELRFLVILDRENDPVGFIAGVDPVALKYKEKKGGLSWHVLSSVRAALI